MMILQSNVSGKATPFMLSESRQEISICFSFSYSEIKIFYLS